jgi:hypothetical protein
VTDNSKIIDEILYEYYINQMTSMRTMPDRVERYIEFLERRDPSFRAGLKQYCGAE